MLRGGSLRTIVAFLLLAIAWAGAGARQATAGEVRGLVFADGRPLSLSWKEAQAGTTVRLCNVGRTDARSVKATLSGFAFEQGSQRVDDAAVVKRVMASSPISAGSCVQLRVQVKPKTKVDRKSYTGVLAATSAGAGIARLPVTIAGPEVSPKPAKVAGARETAELQGTRRLPWKAAHLEDGGMVPLEPPKAGEKLEVGEQCGDPKSGATTACPFVGNLYHGADVAHVYIGGKPESTKGAMLVPLRVDGADEVGDYEGSLDLAQTGKAEDAVKVKLTVTDAWWSALVAVALGAALPILLQLRSGRWRPERLLHDRRRELKDEYSAAEGRFRAKAPGFAGIHRPTDQSIEGYSAAVDRAIRAYAKSSLLFDNESDAYKKIDKSIALAEEDAKCLGSDDGLADSLKGLRDELKTLAAFLRRQYPVPETPALARMAAAVLKGGALAVGEATKRAAAADGYVEVLKQWHEMARQVLRYEAWARLLAPSVSSEAEKRLLHRAAAKLYEVRFELLAASSAAELEHLGTSRDLDTVYQSLIELESSVGPVVLPAEPDLAEMQVEWQAVGVEHVRGLLALGDATLHTVEGWIDQAADLTVRAARSVQITKKAWLWVADVAVLLFAIAVGIVTGLSLVYFGKTFGTFSDYLTVVFVGAASQVLAKGVLDQVAVLWADAVPAVAQDPQRAAVA
jgi:hypothetical protein